MITLYFIEIGSSKFIVNANYLQEFINTYDYNISGYDDVEEFAKQKFQKFEKININDTFEYEEI